MNSSIRIFFTYLILCFIVFSSIAQNQLSNKIPPHSLKNDAVFSGVIKNYQQGDSVWVFFYRDYISGIGESSEDNYIKTLRFNVAPDKKGYFQFALPSLGHVGIMEIGIIRQKKWYLLNTRDMVEPGDHIYMEITHQNDTTFSSYQGIGAVKYELSDLLFYPFGLKTSNMGHPLDDGGLDSFVKRRDSIISNNILKLNKFRGELSPQIYKLFRGNIKACVWTSYAMRIEMVFHDSNEFPAKEKNNLFRNYSKKYRAIIDTTDSQLLTQSPLWVDAIIFETCANLSVQYQRKPTIAEVLRDFEKNFSGILFDKLVGVLLFDPFTGPPSWIIASCTSQEIETAMEDALRFIKTDFIKDAILDQVVIKKGKYAYNFSLPDTNGNIIKLSDLKGKVIVMDTWFTKCTGCAIFYKLLKDSVEPEFKDSSLLQVVSVNVDRDKTMWLTSIYTGIYSDPDRALNLFAGEFSKSFVNFYYHANGLPFIIIIDKQGKIVGRVRNSFNLSEIKPLVNEALNQ